MMRRIAMLAVGVVVLGSSGCSSNPLIGKWKNVEGSRACIPSLVFTSTQALQGDQVPSPGADVTYTIEGKVVYVSGTAAMMGHPPTPYNVADNGDIFLQQIDGSRCHYTRAD